MEQEKKSNGAFVGLVVIIIILVLGGIYIWMSNKNSTEQMEGVRAQSQTVGNQDANALSALEQDSQSIDATTGVDANTVY